MPTDGEAVQKRERSEDEEEFGLATKLAAFVRELKELNVHTTTKRHQTNVQQKRSETLNHLQRIRDQTPDQERLSDANVVLHLPYPFKGTHRPNDRFDWNVNGDFTYFGREDFNTLLRRVLSMRISGGNGYKELYITGSLGSGKSHLVCALVCHLMKMGKRVLYVPDARWLISDPFRYLRDSLQLAFADDPRSLDEIQLCKDLHDFESFSEKVADNGTVMYTFLDQANALDEESAGRSSVSARAELSDFLHRLTYGHYFIQIASGNFAKADKALLAQENVDKLQFNIGLKEEEIVAWWARLPCSQNLSPQFKNIIEDLTGRNPLLLRGAMSAISKVATITAQGKESIFDETFENELLEKICACKDWVESTARVERYAWEFFKKNKGEDDRKMFFTVMEKCILEDTISLAEISLLDNRSLYVDQATSTGRCSSGLAKRAITAFLRKHAGSSVFLTTQWLNMIENLGDNASVLGFFVEQVLLSQIEKNGMLIDGVRYSSMRAVFFEKYPVLPQNFEGGPILFVPKAYNYRAVDGILFSVQRIEGINILNIIAIQITLNKSHKDSEANFFANWPEFSKRSINSDAYDKITITFLWIVEALQNHPNLKEQGVPMKKTTTRGATYETPTYERKVRTIYDISEAVGRKLELAREYVSERKA